MTHEDSGPDLFEWLQETTTEEDLRERLEQLPYALVLRLFTVSGILILDSVQRYKFLQHGVARFQMEFDIGDSAE